MSLNILNITPALFKVRTGASAAIDDRQLFPMIKVASDINLQPLLGSRLYKRLQDGIDNDNLTPDEELLINNYITDALVWYTMSLLPLIMGYQLFSKGFLQKTSDESQAPSRADLELLEGKYKSMAEFYAKRLIVYLKENYVKHYEYINPGSGCDVIFPTSQAYTCPIYLGGVFEPKNPNYVNSSGGSLLPSVAYYTAAAGLSSFTIDALAGREVIAATRSGLSKVVTTTATADTGYLQINNNLVTLPTGDVTLANELFTFLYK